MNHDRPNRRDFLRVSVAAGASGLLGAAPIRPGTADPRFKVAACDWMLIKRQKLGAFALSKDCELDGVEVDLGPLGDRPEFDNRLRDPAVRKQFLDASRDTGVAISSLAMSAFYGRSFADHSKADHFADEWFDTMRAMGVKVGFLPFGVKGNVRDDPAVRSKFVEVLKRVAPKAGATGMVIGIETNLDADGHKRFLDEIGSSSVKVYYNLGDALENK